MSLIHFKLLTKDRLNDKVKEFHFLRIKSISRSKKNVINAILMFRLDSILKL